MVIYIVGYSRSGTKMMNKILRAMGVVEIVPEVHFFEQIYQFESDGIGKQQNNRDVVTDLIKNIRYRRGEQLKNGIKVADIENKLFDFIESKENIAAVDIYIRFLKLLNPKSVALDTTPRNAYFIRNISRLVPNAKFIYMVRDPRDCILSQSVKWRNYYYRYNKPKDALRYFVNFHPVLMSKFWKNSFNEFEKALNDETVKDNILLLRYEDVTAAPYKTAEKVSAFLNIASNPETNLDFINNNNSYKWKTGFSKAKIYLIESNLTEKIKKMGYEENQFSFTDKLKANIIMLFYSLKFPAMLVLNLNRTKNLWASFKLRVLGING